MNFLMNALFQLGTASVLAVGGWFVVTGETEIGTVVAFLSGLSRINGPWGDLVDWLRDLTLTGTKYDLVASAVAQMDEARLAAGKDGKSGSFKDSIPDVSNFRP